jgi:hypothetical protein
VWKARASSVRRSETPEEAVWPRPLPVGPVVFDPSLHTAAELAGPRAATSAPPSTAISLKPELMPMPVPAPVPVPAGPPHTV